MISSQILDPNSYQGIGINARRYFDVETNDTLALVGEIDGIPHVYTTRPIPVDAMISIVRFVDSRQRQKAG